MEVQWKNLYDYPYFQISDLGDIRSLDRSVAVYRNGVHYFAKRKGKEIAQRCTKKNPHMFSTLQFQDDDGNTILKTVYLHKAVADHFIPKPRHILQAEANGKSVCASHIVNDYSINTWHNIEWITMSELISRQPNRDSKQTWITRRALYGPSGVKK